ncbi:MAG: hypothetical protein HZB55_22800 [Deltaproteobacteria bacterium]|nr:hypothetical protein [Deltaproteobacteria bacterium]
MTEKVFGFDEFATKWVPAPPHWEPEDEGPARAGPASEGERRRAYLGGLRQTGGAGLVFSQELQDRLMRDAASGVPFLSILEGLLEDPEVGDTDAIVALVQRVFGVPASRARFIASWRPTNRSTEAKRVLERVALCIADARRAGLWSAPEK